MTDKFILEVIKCIENGLPGEESHLKMTPYRRLVTNIPDDRREGAVLMLLYKNKDNWCFPLTQRQEYKGVHSKQVSFPGGKLEGSESALEAALRETEEEIGIKRERIKLISELTSLYIPPSNFMVYPFIGYVVGDVNFTKEEKEVAEIIEVPINSLLNDVNQRETLVETQFKMKLRTPYFHLKDKVVWGATAAILSEFKDIIKK